MRYVMLAGFAAFVVVFSVRVVQRNRGLGRDGTPATTLTWVTSGLAFAMMTGLLGYCVAMALRDDGVISYGRDVDWITLAWFTVATVGLAVLHMIDTWKRIRKVTRSPLLPPPTSDESSD
jgi:hypothetical protein